MKCLRKGFSIINHYDVMSWRPCRQPGPIQSFNSRSSLSPTGDTTRLLTTSTLWVSENFSGNHGDLNIYVFCNGFNSLARHQHSSFRKCMFGVVVSTDAIGCRLDTKFPCYNAPFRQHRVAGLVEVAGRYPVIDSDCRTSPQFH